MTQGNLEALKILLSETRSLYHQMRLVAEDTYQQETMSGGNRGILHDLECLGPQSESQLEKLRPLSRIHIGEMLKPLRENGYIRNTPQADENEFPLLELTQKGIDFIRSGDKKEMEILSNISRTVPREDILVALDVLRSIRKSFDSDLRNNVVHIGSRGRKKMAGNTGA